MEVDSSESILKKLTLNIQKHRGAWTDVYEMPQFEMHSLQLEQSHDMNPQSEIWLNITNNLLKASTA